MIRDACVVHVMRIAFSLRMHTPLCGCTALPVVDAMWLVRCRVVRFLLRLGRGCNTQQTLQLTMLIDSITGKQLAVYVHDGKLCLWMSLSDASPNRPPHPPAPISRQRHGVFICRLRVSKWAALLLACLARLILLLWRCWLLPQDLFGCCLCATFLSTIRLPSIKVCTADCQCQTQHREKKIPCRF